MYDKRSIKMKKPRKRFRDQSLRLQSWDYSNKGAYFITIVTKNRAHFFGNIVSSSEEPYMNLSPIGQFAHDFWLEIPKHFPYVYLGNFVIMPDHMHGVLILDGDVDNGDKKKIDDGVDDNDGVGIDDDNLSGTPNLGVPTTTTKGGKNPKWKPKTIGVIINQYKRIVTISSRKINPNFGWQSRYYDHIIRNKQSFHRIQNYIKNNPLNW